MTINKSDRPVLPVEIKEGRVSEVELFQNEVIRPVIKQHSDLLFARLNSALVSMNIDLVKLPSYKKREVLTQLFHKYQPFKREIVGMVIGHFTLEEYRRYESIHKAINRRIVQIVLSRCIDRLM